MLRFVLLDHKCLPASFGFCFNLDWFQSIKKNIIIATVLSTFTTGAWYLAINKPR